MQDTPRVYGAERAAIGVARGLGARAGIDVHFLLIEETRLGAGGGGLRREVQRFGLPCTMLPTSQRFSMPLVRRIRRHCEQASATVLHCMGAKASLHGGLAAGWGRRLPVVTTLHGWLERPDVKERLYEKIEAHCLRRMSSVIVLSRAYEERVRERGVVASRLHRIPTGCEPGEIVSYPLAQQTPEHGSHFTVGTPARFSEEKNHNLLLCAAAILRQRGVPVRWHLAGEGPLRLRIEQRVVDSGLADCVRVLPYTEPDEFFADIHALVLGSCNENLPYSVLEAMSWCRPCVVTRVGGLPELVEEGATGYLLRPSDAEGMADSIARLAEDPALARRLGEAARRKVEQEFSLAECVDQHVALYAKLVDDQREVIGNR